MGGAQKDTGASDKSDRATHERSPSVSAVPVGIPSADGSNWTRRVVAVWEEWRFGRFTAFKHSMDGPWHLRDEKGVLYCDTFLSDVMAHAQGIEARRAETQSGSVHESPLAKGHAPNLLDHPSHDSSEVVIGGTVHNQHVGEL